VQATLTLPEGFWDELPADDPARELRELVDDEAEVVIGRRVPAEGRARAMVDGQVAATAGVASIARAAMRFSGQHEHRRLVSPAAQLTILDAFAGKDAQERASRLRRMRRELADIDDALARGRERRADVELARDRLAATVAEIESGGLDPVEKEALTAERGRLRNLERLFAAASDAAEALSPTAGEGGALEVVGNAARELDGLTDVDAELRAAASELRSAQAGMQEAAITLRTYLDTLEAEPGRLDAVEQRLGEYADLERRYGPGVETVLSRLQDATSRLVTLRASVEGEQELIARRAQIHAEATEVAAALSELRASAADALGARVVEELADLAMGAAKLRIALHEDGGDPPAMACEMWLQANPGLPEARLAESASGGELSRVLLALHGVAARTAQAGAWIFDEVDAGIGGVTASAVARRLADLAETHQVVVITHLPQVAALAERHYRLVKDEDEEGVATTSIEPVQGDELIRELCRMLGAEPEDAGARRHAKELLARRG
jgi:DNA repair protein RecN (Recombination protein N)